MLEWSAFLHHRIRSKELLEMKKTFAADLFCGAGMNIADYHPVPGTQRFAPSNRKKIRRRLHLWVISNVLGTLLGLGLAWLATR